MRILIVTGHPTPHRMGLWKAVSDAGVDLHIAACVETSPFGPLPSDVGIPDFGTTHLHRPAGWTSRGFGWWIYPGLGGLIQRIEPDVVHILAEPWALLVTQSLRHSRAVVSHGAELVWSQGSTVERNLRLSLARRNMNSVAGLASWTLAGISVARAAGLPQGKPTLALCPELPVEPPFSFATEQRADARARLGWAAHEVVFGFVGRFAPEKGPDLLLRAFQQADLPGTRLAFLGSGPLKKSLKLGAQEGGAIEFHEPIGAEEIPRFMAALDVLVVPSVSTDVAAEQFSRVAAEAMLAGTAVIASNAGALEEVVGDAAVVVPQGDEDALRGALERLADAEVRKVFSARSAERAHTNFSATQRANELVEFWNQICLPK